MLPLQIGLDQMVHDGRPIGMGTMYSLMPCLCVLVPAIFPSAENQHVRVIET